MFSRYYKIGIIGAGGWGTALSCVLTANGHKVSLWSYDEATVEEINEYQKNTTFLSGVELPKKIRAFKNISRLRGNDLYILATPSQYVSRLFDESKFSFRDKPVISVVKGIERKTLLRISEILNNKFNVPAENFAVLTGPSHAEEVARLAPTTIVAASENPALAQMVQSIFTNEVFRVYTSDDVVGCEIGGSLKNVIAIAAGIIDGLGIGDNTKAALITRGLAEMSRLGITLGAKHQTFSGLSGLGDLFVTCNSKHSRNRAVGEQIGKGKTLEEIISESKMFAEGIYTTESAYELGKKHDVDMPIAQQMYKILFRNKEPKTAIRDLMNRQTKREWWW